MAITKQTQKLLTKAEIQRFNPYFKTPTRKTAEIPEKRIKAAIAAAKDKRSKYSDLAKRQRAEAKTKSGSRDAAGRTKEKQSAFSEILKNAKEALKKAKDAQAASDKKAKTAKTKTGSRQKPSSASATSAKKTKGTKATAKTMKSKVKSKANAGPAKRAEPKKSDQKQEALKKDKSAEQSAPKTHTKNPGSAEAIPAPPDQMVNPAEAALAARKSRRKNISEDTVGKRQELHFAATPVKRIVAHQGSRIKRQQDRSES